MVSFSKCSNLDQKWVGQITKGNISFSFLCYVFCEKQEFIQEFNNFLELLDYSYGPQVEMFAHPDLDQQYLNVNALSF